MENHIGSFIRDFAAECGIVLISSGVSSLAHAYSDSQVASWAQSILMDTLSASYLDKPADSIELQKMYTRSAWDPMLNFFNQERALIQTHKLTLHPKALTEPAIVRTSDCMETYCWRFNQSYTIPELYMHVDFSLLIVGTNSPKGSPFLVQSVNMKTHHY